MSWKCRCGAVELPVCPTRPSTSPLRTLSPERTATEPGVRWANPAHNRRSAGSRDCRAPGELLRRRSEGRGPVRRTRRSLLERIDRRAPKRPPPRRRPRRRAAHGSAHPAVAGFVGTPVSSIRNVHLGSSASPSGVEPDQVERIPLTQDVRSVARDAIRGRTHRAPFAAQRELDRACVRERDGGFAGPAVRASGHPPDDTVAPDRLRVEPAQPRRLTHPIDRDRVRGPSSITVRASRSATASGCSSASSSAATMSRAPRGNRPGVAHRARDRRRRTMAASTWTARRGRGSAFTLHVPADGPEDAEP